MTYQNDNKVTVSVLKDSKKKLKKPNTVTIGLVKKPYAPFYKPPNLRLRYERSASIDSTWLNKSIERSNDQRTETREQKMGGQLSRLHESLDKLLITCSGSNDEAFQNAFINIQGSKVRPQRVSTDNEVNLRSYDKPADKTFYKLEQFSKTQLLEENTTTSNRRFGALNSQDSNASARKAPGRKKMNTSRDWLKDSTGSLRDKSMNIFVTDVKAKQPRHPLLRVNKAKEQSSGQIQRAIGKLERHARASKESAVAWRQMEDEPQPKYREEQAVTRLFKSLHSRYRLKSREHRNLLGEYGELFRRPVSYREEDDRPFRLLTNM